MRSCDRPANRKRQLVPTILIISLGSLMGHNILTALQFIRDRLFVIGSETNPAAANNFRCDAAYLIPPTNNGPLFERKLHETVVTADVELVLTGTNNDLPVLARMSTGETRSDRVLLVPPSKLVEICNDKYEKYRFAREHGLP